MSTPMPPTTGEGPDQIPVSPPQQPDAALPILSTDDAARLVRLTRAAFAELGYEITYRDGGFTGLDQRYYGLHNLALRATSYPRDLWPQVATQHAQSMVAAIQQPDTPPLDEVRDRLLPRLRAASDLPFVPNGTPLALPGIVIMLAIDYPTHVQELPIPHVEKEYGTWEQLLPLLLDNLRALPAPQHHPKAVTDNPNSTIHFFHTPGDDDVYCPSRLLILPELLDHYRIEPSPYGMVVGIPQRHLMMVQVIRDASVMDALGPMTNIAMQDHANEPGSITARLFYVSPGQPAQCITTFEDDRIRLNTEAPFGQVLDSLGI